VREGPDARMAGTITRPLARFVLIVEAAAVSVVVAEEVITAVEDAVATTGTLSRTPTGDSRRASRTAPEPESHPRGEKSFLCVVCS